ncbi:hypothetical protein F6B93_18975 [Mycobacterium spongiae]|uniref:Mammalian cell entry protein n=1 Tax=Mycobacterium spongiae TaxID=886343 RepID=A0A975PZ58_9MYCO|nr:hypothetical protein F6B93_18975 [Mycobacterium spongiae]
MAAAGPREDAHVAVAEAEDEVARAEVRAEAARARATRLRRQAVAASATGMGPRDNARLNSEHPNTTAVHDEANAADEVGSPPKGRHRRWLHWVRRPRWKECAVVAAIGVITASLGASGFIELEHRSLLRKQRLSAEFAAAARRGITALLSIDANHARQDLQRTIDESTGGLKDQLELTGVALAERVEQSKISTRVAVDAVAVESMTFDSAVVLVEAKSETIYPDNAQHPLSSWRISVNLSRDDGQIKMSQVDFLR